MTRPRYNPSYNAIIQEEHYQQKYEPNSTGSHIKGREDTYSQCLVGPGSGSRPQEYQQYNLMSTKLQFHVNQYVRRDQKFYNAMLHTGILQCLTLQFPSGINKVFGILYWIWMFKSMRLEKTSLRAKPDNCKSDHQVRHFAKVIHDLHCFAKAWNTSVASSQEVGTGTSSTVALPLSKSSTSKVSNSWPTGQLRPTGW